MCGIAGILSFENQHSEYAGKVTAMQAALLHRGPDDTGLFHSTSTPTVLAHTRLAIIALGPDGHQPMSIDSSRYWITYNGEIYNHAELRSWLRGQGLDCATTSDTEIILQLYALEGADCVKRLQGMFAFVIWDEQTQTGFAARDPMGIKPLYYQDLNGEFIFASELRALLRAELSEPSLNKQSAFEYFRSGSVAEPNTLIEGMRMLEAGTCLKISNSGIEKHTYWQASFPTAGNSQMDRKAAVAITRQAIIDSIERHLVSDVPVGLFLSGGIDSTVILALASQISDKPIETFSIAFEDPLLNEGDLARRVAEKFGAEHTELRMSAESARPLFQSFLNDMDQPTIDGFNTYCVAKLAHDNGIKVSLSGLGADELFGGYKSFQVIPKMARVSSIFAVMAPLLALIEKKFTSVLQPKHKRLLDMFEKPGSLLLAQRSLRGIFSKSEANSLAKTLTTKGKTEPVLEISQADQISKIELETYLRNQLLRDSDVMSMAWGLELRVPFIDSVFIDTILKIPSAHRISEGKQLLIDAVPEVPEWIYNRPKQGFAFPFDAWFKEDWNSIPLKTKTPTWLPLTPWYRRWSLTVIEHWSDRHLVKSKN